MTCDLTDPIFTDEEAARKHFEVLRWPNGPFCPHCGAASEHVTLMNGNAHRPGLYQCNACRESFTVKLGTVMESSHIPYRKWALGFHLMAAGKKGVSAHQLHRMLGLTYKTAWFMAHRIREAMQSTDDTPLGGEGSFVEADETFVGGKARNRAYRKPASKKAVVSPVERQGRARSRIVADVTADDLRPILEAGVDKASNLRTDESGVYWKISETFASHKTVNHSADEYVRGDAHTNTVEGFFSILKRGIYGTYHHVSAAHLHRYLAEFDFRCSYRVKLGFDDAMRADLMIRGAAGKRLTDRQSGRTQQATA